MYISAGRTDKDLSLSLSLSFSLSLSSLSHSVVINPPGYVYFNERKKLKKYLGYKMGRPCAKSGVGAHGSK